MKMKLIFPKLSQLRSQLFVPFLAGMILAPALAQCQSLSSDGQKTTAIMLKIHQLGLLQRILPLNLNEKELDAILDSIDTTREAVRKTERNEYRVLKVHEPAVEAAIANGLSKDEVPDDKLTMAIQKDFALLQVTRQIVAAGNIEAVYKVVQKVCDSGQKNLMANGSSLPATASKGQKIRDFISSFLMDPSAYVLLTKLDVKLHQGS